MLQVREDKAQGPLQVLKSDRFLTHYQLLNSIHFFAELDEKKARIFSFITLFCIFHDFSANIG